MYKEILKKKKKEIEQLAPDAKPLHIGKKAMMHAMESMAPEMEDEEGEDDSKEQKMASKKSMLPEAKIEIELMLEGAKKKKKS